MNIVAVDADLTGSTTTKKFAQARPENEDRLFNVGIAEQNMVGVAAGLSLAGNIAFTGSFAVFGTGRAYDQIRNTVCYSNLNVKIAPTHAAFRLALMVALIKCLKIFRSCEDCLICGYWFLQIMQHAVQQFV